MNIYITESATTPVAAGQCVYHASGMFIFTVALCEQIAEISYQGAMLDSARLPSTSEVAAAAPSHLAGF